MLDAAVVRASATMLCVGIRRCGRQHLRPVATNEGSRTAIRYADHYSGLGGVRRDILATRGTT